PRERPAAKGASLWRGGGARPSVTKTAAEEAKLPSEGRVTHARRRSNSTSRACVPPLSGVYVASTNDSKSVPSVSTTGISARLCKLFGITYTGSSKLLPPLRDRAMYAPYRRPSVHRCDDR